MANQGVTGRIVDADTSAGVPNLTVEVYDVDTLSPDDWLGQATTDNNGAFSISYSPSDYGLLEKQPDLLVRVYDSVKRLMKVDGPHNNVTDTTLALNDIPIKRADYEGWLVTLGNGTPAFLSQGNDATLLIDNELAWQDVTDAIHNGHTDVHLILLMLHVKKLFTEFSPAPSVGQPAKGSRIEDEIVQGASGTMVGRLVIHESIMWPFPPDTEGDVESYYGKGPPHDVKVRPFKFWPGHYMHAKNVIVDGQTGYVVGSPFIQEYFDARDHQIDDMRRGSWYFMWNFIRTPIHDVSVKLTGPIVVDLANNSFRLHWNQVKTEDPVAALPAPNPAPSGAIGIQLTRTLCGKTFTGIQTGETGILESYQRAFRNAEDFIYIENQYFTSEDIIDSLYLTVQQKPNLQVILLLNFTVDAPGYNHFQCRAISRLWEKLKANPADASRVELFTLWSHEQSRAGDSDTRSRIIRTYIHSKTSIIDDKWATIGSANLDGIGMRTLDHITGDLHDLPEVPEASDYRSTEINVVFYNNVDNQLQTPFIDQLRRELWAEHLGYRDGAGAVNPEDNELQSQNRPAKGWIDLWKNKAQAKLSALKQNPPSISAVRILPWPRESSGKPMNVNDPKKHLKALGIDTDAVNVMTEVRQFDLSKGDWK